MRLWPLWRRFAFCLLGLVAASASELATASDDIGQCVNIQPGQELWDSAEQLSNSVTGAGDKTSDGKGAPTPAEVVESAKAYLKSIRGPQPDPCDLRQPEVPKFDASVAREKIKSLKAIETSSAPVSLRSEAYFVDAGITGMVAGLLHSGEDGKAAYAASKSAIEADPSNLQAVIGNARTLAVIKGKDLFSKKIVLFALGIDLDKEIAAALENLKRVKGPSCLTDALNAK